MFRRTVAMIHIDFDRIVVFFNVIDDPVLNSPFEKVELANGGLHNFLVVVGDRNALPSTKGVEPTLRISLEFELVVVVYFESLTFFGISLVRKFVYGIVFLGIIGHEPIDNA